MIEIPTAHTLKRGERQEPTTLPQIEASISLLSTKKHAWATTALREKIRLLEAVANAFVPLCDSWVQAGLAAKHAQQDSYASGWEWAGGPMPILRYMRALKRTMTTLESTGRPPLPSPLLTRANGQVSTRVYPTDLYERFTTPGTTVDVWMEPGPSAEDVLAEQALPNIAPHPGGQLCLVLGAGNVSAGPFNDCLAKLYVENSVVLLKMNPVNEYLGPLIETAMEPLISQGYLQVVYGGASEGSYIAGHPSVDSIYMMGSDRTYEAIAFGTGPEGLRRKLERDPICVKSMTAELGNVAPAIIVPGPWSERDLSYQGQQLASHLCDSGGYSCSRTRVIVQHSQWTHRHQLMDHLRAALTDVPTRHAYYPGASQLFERFMSAYPQAQRIGAAAQGTLPWTVIQDVIHGSENEICYNTESFCPVIAETSLEAPTPAEFVAKAVDFCNNELWGTLSASIIVHPQSLRDPDLVAAIERAIENLHYGVVAVNCLPGLPWAMAVPPWGSYPGNPPWDIQSGSGFVHNAYMFARPQKTVVRAPFRTWPPPPWFPSRAHRMTAVCKRVAAYEARPSVPRMLGIAIAALR